METDDIFKPLLETDRLKLRMVDPSVYKQLFSGVVSDDELMAFFGFSDPEKLKEERERFDLGLRTFNRTFRWFQLLEKSTMEIVGQAGFHTIFPYHSRAELFYSIFKEENRRKGIISEALSAVLPFGFNQIWLNRIEALTSPNNEASKGVLKKFGFQFESVLKEHYRVETVLEDSCQYSLLKSQWEARFLL